MKAILRTAASSPTFGSLSFSGAAHPGGGDFKCLATVEADRETYEVELEMIHAYRRDMLGYFEEIGKDAHQGWSGEERWQSESSELEISATATGDGHVHLAVQMRWPPNYDDDWRGTLVVTAEALAEFAQRMRELLRMEHGSRFRPVPRQDSRP